ncbi:MAG TPA: hypothetical protein PKM65_09440 [Spirochaetota bacterium]|nr:hypothetical protein [Spirochaetota bacterium]HNT12748.1 hypothetical protein [Spirochaetota bacterium]
MTIPHERKRCTRCGEEKALSEFYPLRDGYNAWCKVCHRAYQGRRRKGVQSRQGPRLEGSNGPYNVQMKVDFATYGEFREYILRTYGRNVRIVDAGSEIFSHAIREFLKGPKKIYRFNSINGECSSIHERNSDM